MSSEASTLTITVQPPTAALEVRVAARRVSRGRFEFALQERSLDGEWQDRILPRLRFLPASATVGRWLHSNAFTVGESERSLRISARRVSHSRVEFAIQVRLEDGDWGERLLPRRRFLRSSAPIDRWFVSTPLDAAEP